MNQTYEAMSVTLLQAGGIRAHRARQLVRRALDCDYDVRVSSNHAGNVICWTDELHPERSGRLALVPATTGVTELHLVMRSGREDVRDVMQRLLYLLQSREYALALA